MENTRDKILKDFHLRTNVIMESLDSFSGKGDSNISKSELKSFNEMEWIWVNEKVRIRRRKDMFEDTLVFDTVISEGGQFGAHIHIDCIEHCDVIKGELTDLLTNKTYKEGEVVLFNQGQKHLPMSTVETILKVYFR
jgi:hypothetical protein